MASRESVPLIIEPHPKNYRGYPFVTLIQYRKTHHLAIVDNIDQDVIKAFVLDLCGPENVDEEMIISIAADWYEWNATKYPISFEFSKKGLTTETSRIYRTFNIEFVSRVIGPVPKFPMHTVRSVKRRRRKTISAGVEIQRKVVPITRSGS